MPSLYAPAYTVSGSEGSNARPRRWAPAKPKGFHVPPPSSERITPCAKVAAYRWPPEGSSARSVPVDRGWIDGMPATPSFVDPENCGTVESIDQVPPPSVDRTIPPPAPFFPTPAYTTPGVAVENRIDATWSWLPAV